MERLMYVVLLKYFLKARNVAELVEWLPACTMPWVQAPFPPKLGNRSTHTLRGASEEGKGR